MTAKEIYEISILWFKQANCKHISKTEILRDYPDRYVCKVCDKCGKNIYTDF
jgi:hypothetical protein